MRLSVIADQPGAVDRKAHRQFLDRDIVYDLVVGALQECRIDRGKGAQAGLGPFVVILKLEVVIVCNVCCLTEETSAASTRPLAFTSPTNIPSCGLTMLPEAPVASSTLFKVTVIYC